VPTAGLGNAAAAAILTELARTMTDPRPIGFAGAEEASDPVVDAAPMLIADSGEEADPERNSER